MAELIIKAEGMNDIHMRTPLRWRAKIWKEKINNAKAYLLPPDQREAFLLANKTAAQRMEEQEVLDDDFHTDFESLVSEQASVVDSMTGSDAPRDSLRDSLEFDNDNERNTVQET